MLWRGSEGSSNVEDRRGIGGGVAATGIGGIIVYVIYLFLGGDPSNAPQINPSGGQTQSMSAEQKAADDTTAAFVSVVLRHTENVWNELLPNYREPKLVMFRDATQSACGSASSASGPFYCPGDSKVYIDLSFFQDLAHRFGAAGDFAQAYVIAHEVGHHVQNLMGTTDKVHNLRQQVSEKEYNRESVKLELQADFYAGVWAHYLQQLKSKDGQQILNPDDIDEALRAANAIGDDRLQQQSQGQVVPDAFTHGTSAQRMYWFKKGYQTGDIKQGDTFNASDL